MQNVVQFPRPYVSRNRLTSTDRAELCSWDVQCCNPNFDRVVIHDQHGTTDPVEPDLVLIHAPGSAWASWGLARHDGAVVLWECAGRMDLGRFETMREALDALEDHVGPALQRRKTRWQRPTVQARKTAIA